MKKTILDWFLEAKENGAEWADAAIKNTGLDLLSSEEVSLSIALHFAFVWKNTDEGHSYWSMIHTQILDSE